MACDHKLGIGCVLTATETCCSCSDQRPLARAYPIYIDGQGMKMRGKRWARYCWKCKDHWNREEVEDERRQRGSADQEPTWSFASPRPASNHRTRQRQPPPRSRNEQSYPVPSSEPPLIGMEAQFQGLGLRGGDPTLRLANSRRRRAPNNRTASPQPRREPSESVTTLDYQPQPPQQPRQNPLVAAFGTREEIESENYQSPLEGMFERWDDRYRRAEQQRRELEDDMLAHLLDTSFASQPRRDIANIPNPFQPREPLQAPNSRHLVSSTPPVSRHGDELHPSALPAEHGARRLAQRASRIANSVAEQTSHSHPRHYSPSPPRPNPIDSQTSRPPGLSQSEMTTSIACRICNEQRSDTLLNPCMHICMCHWCSDIIRSDAVAARRNGLSGAPGWRCPICRKGIAGTTRVYLC